MCGAASGDYRANLSTDAPPFKTLSRWKSGKKKAFDGCADVRALPTSHLCGAASAPLTRFDAWSPFASVCGGLMW